MADLDPALGRLPLTEAQRAERERVVRLSFGELGKEIAALCELVRSPDNPRLLPSEHARIKAERKAGPIAPVEINRDELSGDALAILKQLEEG